MTDKGFERALAMLRDLLKPEPERKVQLNKTYRIDKEVSEGLRFLYDLKYFQNQGFDLTFTNETGDYEKVKICSYEITNKISQNR
jgi:hypothetical protein